MFWFQPFINNFVIEINLLTFSLYVFVHEFILEGWPDRFCVVLLHVECTISEGVHMAPFDSKAATAVCRVSRLSKAWARSCSVESAAWITASVWPSRFWRTVKSVIDHSALRDANFLLSEMKRSMTCSKTGKYLLGYPELSQSGEIFDLENICLGLRLHVFEVRKFLLKPDLESFVSFDIQRRTRSVEQGRESLR